MLGKKWLGTGEFCNVPKGDRNMTPHVCACLWGKRRVEGSEQMFPPYEEHTHNCKTKHIRRHSHSTHTHTQG